MPIDLHQLFLFKLFSAFRTAAGTSEDSCLALQKRTTQDCIAVDADKYEPLIGHEGFNM